jgi:hypothetical protein
MFDNLLLAIKLELEFMEDMLGQHMKRFHSQGVRKRWLINRGIYHFKKP